MFNRCMITSVDQRLVRPIPFFLYDGNNFTTLSTLLVWSIQHMHGFRVYGLQASCPIIKRSSLSISCLPKQLIPAPVVNRAVIRLPPRDTVKYGRLAMSVNFGIFVAAIRPSIAFGISVDEFLSKTELIDWLYGWRNIVNERQFQIGISNRRRAAGCRSHGRYLESWHQIGEKPFSTSC